MEKARARAGRGGRVHVFGLTVAALSLVLLSAMSAAAPQYAVIGGRPSAPIFVAVPQGIQAGVGGTTGTGVGTGGAGGVGGGGNGGGPVIANAGFTAGQPGVDRAGGATYSVPIPVPPGTAGLEPKLELKYSSHAGNGLVGIGWSLSGLSQITRCHGTTAQDGIPSAVKYDLTDRYCLDGQRLVMVTPSGTYGADNVEYRTELDTFTRVVSHGSTGGKGPLYWTAQTKGGQTFEYGKDTPTPANYSAVPAQGQAAIAVWAVNKVSDTAGNEMTFTYVQDTANGSFAPSTIDYGGNPTAAPPTTAYAHVQFTTVTTRPDVASAYAGGSAINQRYRLTDIRTLNGATLVRKFNLAYSTATTVQYSRLDSLQECNGASQCFGATQLTWVPNGTESFATNSVWANGATPSTPYGNVSNVAFKDVNGDGVADLVHYAIKDQTCSPTCSVRALVYVRLSSKTGFGTETLWLNNSVTTVATGYNQGYFADMDADGLPDLVVVSHGTTVVGGDVYVCINAGTFFHNCSSWDSSTTQNLGGFVMAVQDMNGDGHADLVKMHGDAGGSKMLVRLTNAAGTGFGAETSWDNDTTQNYVGWQFTLADVNGDGMGDFVKYYIYTGGGGSTGSRAKVRLSTGGGLATESTWDNVTATSYGPGWSIDFADMNGDGMADLVKKFISPSAPSGTRLVVSPSTGTTFAAGTYWDNETSGYQGPDWYLTLSDVNGDGMTDLVKNYANGTMTKSRVRLSTGQGFVASYADWADSTCGFTPIENYAGSPGCLTTFADVTGDGTADLIKYWYYTATTNWNTQATVMKGNLLPSNLVAKVTDGQGAAVNFTFGWLTDAALYTKGSSATYPQMDIQTAGRVVKQIDVDTGGDPTPPSTGQRTTIYTYGTERIDLKGRGYLGFNTVASTDANTGFKTTTTYNQTFPQIGQITNKTEKQANGTLISSTAATLAQLSTVSGVPAVQFPYVSTTTTSRYEVSGSPTIQTTNTFTYDTYGNPLTAGTSVKDNRTGGTGQVFTTTTKSAFHNNVGLPSAPWLPGRLICAQTTKTTPFGNATRTAGFEYDATKGLLTKEAIEPKSADIAEPSGLSLPAGMSTDCVTAILSSDPTYNTLSKVTAYGLDAFGNKATVTVSGNGFSPRTLTNVWGESNGAGVANTPLNGRFLIQKTLPTVGGIAQVEKYSYDGRFGFQTLLKDANGLSTTRTDDNFGRVLTEVQPDGTTLTTSRSDCQSTCPVGTAVLAIKTTVMNGTVNVKPAVRSYVDVGGHEVATETIGFDGHAVFMEKVYDVFGHVVRASRPYYDGRIPVWTYFAFDSFGRPIASTSKNSAGQYATSSIAYDDLNFTTTTTNEKGQVNSSVVNARGDLLVSNKAVGTAAASSMSYSYDAFGNLVQTTDNAGNHITNTFDIRGRKVQMVDPDMGTWTYVYDGLDELLQQTDAVAPTYPLVNQYDLLGRLVQRTDASGGPNQEIATFVYDTAPTAGKGKLYQVYRGGTLEQQLTYDSVGRPSQETHTIDGVGYTYTTTYNSAGQVASLNYPTSPHYPTSGLPVYYTYTAAGYLATLQDAASSPTTTYWQATAKDAEGHLAAFTLGNAIKTQQAFNPYTGLVSTINSSSNNFTSNDIQQDTYGFDAIGNLTSRQDGRQSVVVSGSTVPLSESFTYDGDNRVIGAQVVGQTAKSYAYDAIGNLTTRDTLGTLGYGSFAGPHAVTSAGGQTYTYDANGNRLLQKAGATTIGTISYTAFNKPKHIDNLGAPLGSGMDFVYGADRDRIKQTDSDGRVLLYVQGPARYEVEKLPAVGGVSTWTHTHYLTVQGQTIALHKSIGSYNGTTESAVAQQVRYLHFDHLGSVVAVSNESHAVLERFSFDVWGKRRNATGWTDATAAITSNVTVRGYTGHEQLDAVNLVHMNGRVYDPVVGRFTSADPHIQAPTAPGSFNRYSYVINNPLSLTDPTGFEFADFGGLGLGSNDYGFGLDFGSDDFIDVNGGLGYLDFSLSQSSYGYGNGFGSIDYWASGQTMPGLSQTAGLQGAGFGMGLLSRSIDQQNNLVNWSNGLGEWGGGFAGRDGGVGNTGQSNAFTSSWGLRQAVQGYVDRGAEWICCGDVRSPLSAVFGSLGTTLNVMAVPDSGAEFTAMVAGGPIFGKVGAVGGEALEYAAKSGIQANKIAGDAAADFLNSVYGGTREVSRSTSLGTRYLDNLADGVAMESKVGRTSLSSRVDLQIQKDVELLNTPGSGVNAVEWHFFPGKTGVGPTAPLLQQLESCGITVCIH